MSPNLIWAALQKSYYRRIEEARQEFQTIFIFLDTRGQHDAYNETLQGVQNSGVHDHDEEVKHDFDVHILCQ